MMKTFFTTLIVGIAGLYIGAVLNMEGYLGVIVSVASVGAFIVDAINKRTN